MTDTLLDLITYIAIIAFVLALLAIVVYMASAMRSANEVERMCLEAGWPRYKCVPSTMLKHDCYCIRLSNGIEMSVPVEELQRGE